MKAFAVTLAGLLLPALSALGADPAPSAAKVIDLRVEFQTNPTAVNSPLPRFSWRIETEERGWLQKWYHILVASSPELLAQDTGDLWDSGATLSSTSQLVIFSGRPLASEQNAYWKVKVVERRGTKSAWSTPAQFTTRFDRKPEFALPLLAINSPILSGFESSDSQLNQLFLNTPESFKSLETPRDIGIGMRAAAFFKQLNSDVAAWVDLLNYSVDPAGFYPAMLPPDGTFGSTRSDAAIQCCHSLWWMSGDSAIFSRNFGTMKNYIMARKQLAKAVGGYAFGELPEDTLPSGDQTPVEFIHLTTQALNLRLLLDMSRFASKDPYETVVLKQYYESLSQPFAAEHLQPDGSLKYSSATAHIIALRSGLLTTEEQKRMVGTNLVKLLEKAENPSAIFQTPYAAQSLLPVLTWSGHTSRALNLVQSLDPATLPPAAMAEISEWLISMLAGIDSAAPGYKSVRLEPRIVNKEQLSFVKAHFTSPYGRIASYWYYDGDKLKYDVTIPPNLTGTIQLPVKRDRSISENGIGVESSKDLFGLVRDEASTRFQIGSGSYSFTIGD